MNEESSRTTQVSGVMAVRVSRREPPILPPRTAWVADRSEGVGDHGRWWCFLPAEPVMPMVLGAAGEAFDEEADFCG